jgi:TRAP-type C4-dicarboxylate transport system permease small subunit
MRTLLDLSYKLLAFLACVALIAAFVAVGLSIVTREMGWDLQGLDAYAGYAIAAALFLALPGTFKRGEHIRVTLLLDHLRPPLRKLLEWWSLAAGFVLALFMAVYAVRLVWISYDTHDVSQAMDATPLWIPQLAMALGCAVFALALLDAMVTRARGGSFFDSVGEAARAE